jgi:hypothetical protein
MKDKLNETLSNHINTEIVLGYIKNGLLLITLCVFISWLLFPEKFSHQVYTGFILNVQNIVFWGGIICLLIAALLVALEEKWGLSVGIVVGAMIIAYITVDGYHDIRLSYIAKIYPATPIEQPVQMTSQSILHTPRDVAETEISSAVSTSSYLPDTQTLDVTVDDEGNFDFVEAVNPHTMYTKYFIKNGIGYVILHDHREGEKRKVFTDTSISIGENLFWRNGINNHLYRDRLFSRFGSVLPVPTSVGGNERVILVANNTQLSWLLHIPKWLGVKVVDGQKVEFLNPKQSGEDPRLIGRPIFPREIAEEIIEAQVYEHGLFGNFGRQDIIEFSKNKDGSHLQEIRDGNGRLYYFAPVQGKSTNSIVAYYYVDAATGDLFKYVLPKLTTHFGYKRAELAVKSASTRTWSDIYSVENLQYFTRNDNSTWVIGTITQTSFDTVTNKTIHTYVESVVVNDADDTEKTTFKRRSDLIHWADSDLNMESLSSSNIDELYQNLQSLRDQETQVLEQIKQLQGV